MDKYEDLIKNMKANGFLIDSFSNRDELNNYLLEQIEEDKSIGFGGSITVDDIGIYDRLKDRGNNVYWHWKEEDKKNTLRQARNSDIYISSSNAVTIDGKLVNIDGTGNRVASMIYGHEIVYIIIGKNKICKDYHDAKKYIETVSAPKNAKRLNKNTPCAITGVCSDCNSSDRICGVESIISRNPKGTQIHICIINEELGY